MSKKKILLIDDEANFTELVKLNLEETGMYEVRAENNGKDGIAATEEFKPDLIFLDVIMPDMDGGDVAQEIKSNPQTEDIPIVFLTALVQEKEVTSKQGNIAGRSFLAKPVSVEKLIECIRQNIKE